ncbi:membrane protein, partial [Streptomyces sp. NRRL F-6602]
MASTPHENEPGSRHPDGGASVAPADEGDREVRGEGGGSGKGAAKKLLPVVLVLTGVLSAMLVVFGLPAVNGGPHHVPVGLV